ncbi:uncharacterized protein LOC126406530 isoform X4 [Epinephelus moara]|nr:uncharacterized protein LOC126406530 isoform X4 [Epinephelus moara]
MASPDPPVPVALDPPAVSVAPVTTPPLTTPPLTRPPLTRPPLTTPPLTTPTQACVGANTDQAVTDHATTDHATTDHDTSSPKWNLGSLSRTTCSVDRIPSTQNMEKERMPTYSVREPRLLPCEEGFQMQSYEGPKNTACGVGTVQTLWKEVAIRVGAG